MRGIGSRHRISPSPCRPLLLHHLSQAISDVAEGRVEIDKLGLGQSPRELPAACRR